VLVVLLTQAGSVVPASRIIDAVWGDEPPASAANLVQGSISPLRKAVGRDAIQTRGAGYVARVEPDALAEIVTDRSRLARVSRRLHESREKLRRDGSRRARPRSHPSAPEPI
jgi:hypothetical protein